ncbi:MAG: glycosyl transferase [Clostridia bacterium]|nr:glycosyl transferase [Clostridia bacterium]
MKNTAKLQIKNLLKWIPDKAYLNLRYMLAFHKKLNLKNPQTYNEKLQWMKLYDRNPLYNQLVDKYDVRSFIKDRIGEEYLIPAYGVWDSFDEVDFDSLPEEFVLKCTHDSGSVYICRDKSKNDKEWLKNRFNEALKGNQYHGGREWAYKDVKPRIVAEKFMADDSGTGLKDYKFFCFNGEVKAMFIATERNVEGKDVKFDFFDENFNHLPFKHGHENAKETPKKPEGFEEMKEIAKKLSQGLRHVRVDLYNINGKIYFGEMTFYHHCGFVSFEPNEWDYKFGSWIDLTEEV